jgi:hypothetical protein
MPNTFITPAIISRLAYANLYQNRVMAALVHRDYSGDYQGAVGDTITIRKPATFEAEEYNRTTGIVVQDATEGSMDVVLDTLLDVSFAVTAEQLTLEIANFNDELVAPATEAIMQGIEAKILTLRDDITQEVGGAGDPNPWDDPRALLDARRVLNQAKVPWPNRSAIIGPEMAAAYLQDPLFVQADQRGDTDGLREARVGRKFGFDVFESNAIMGPGPTIDMGESTTEVGVAFHETAFALVTRTLALPKGAASAAVFSGEGFGIRVVMDYDIDQKQDVVSMDVLLGVKTLDATRAVLIKGDDGT